MHSPALLHRKPSLVREDPGLWEVIRIFCLLALSEEFLCITEFLPNFCEADNIIPILQMSKTEAQNSWSIGEVRLDLNSHIFCMNLFFLSSLSVFPSSPQSSWKSYPGLCTCKGDRCSLNQRPHFCFWAWHLGRSTEIKSVGSVARVPETQPWLCLSISGCPWPNLFASLCLRPSPVKRGL